jgi:hypothetical protein
MVLTVLRSARPPLRSSVVDPRRNPAFGLRDIADVSAAGANFSFRLLSANDMPANNFLLTFVKESGSAHNAAL